MSDGKVQLVGGKVLVSAAGKVATADECCCCAKIPCPEDCNGVVQPSAVVTVSGGVCDAFCSLAASTVPWLCADTYLCAFQWFLYDPDHDREVSVNILNATLYARRGPWWGFLDLSQYSTGFFTQFVVECINTISCDPITGHLVGSFQIPGWFNPPTYDCSACILTVTLGP